MAARNVLDYRKPPNRVNLLHLAMVCFFLLFSICNLRWPGQRRFFCLLNMILPDFIQAVDCQWSTMKFGPCSTTCGKGIRIGYRYKLRLAENGGKECTGLPTTTKSCESSASCNGMFFLLFSICNLRCPGQRRFFCLLNMILPGFIQAVEKCVILAYTNLTFVSFS